MHYSGPDRRIHNVFVTRNSEYHVRRDICIAVRANQSRIWTPGHEAVGMQLKYTEPKEYIEGTQLVFSSPFTSVQTSPVEGVYRPEFTIYEFYELLQGISPRPFLTKELT